MSKKQLMDNWWNEVKRLLVESYKIPPRVAAQKVRRRREFFAKENFGKKFDILYHEHPATLAEAIVEK